MPPLSGKEGSGDDWESCMNMSSADNRFREQVATRTTKESPHPQASVQTFCRELRSVFEEALSWVREYRQQLQALRHERMHLLHSHHKKCWSSATEAELQGEAGGTPCGEKIWIHKYLRRSFQHHTVTSCSTIETQSVCSTKNILFAPRAVVFRWFCARFLERNLTRGTLGRLANILFLQVVMSTNPTLTYSSLWTRSSGDSNRFPALNICHSHLVRDATCPKSDADRRPQRRNFTSKLLELRKHWL